MKFKDLFSFGRKPQKIGAQSPKKISPDRPECPFYGFAMVTGLMFDIGHGSCGLINDILSPCRMETNREVPCWTSCDINTPENRVALAAQGSWVHILPKELKPEGNWTGIPLNEWLDMFENR